MKKVILILFSFMLLGCFNRKTALKENLQQNKKENITTSKQKNTFKNSVDSIIYVEDFVFDDNSIIRWIETKFSEPDAKGNQHKISEKTTEIKKDISAKKKVDEKILKKKGERIKSLEKENAELREQVKYNQDKKTKTKTPIKIYLMFYILGLLTIQILKLWIGKHKY